MNVSLNWCVICVKYIRHEPEKFFFVIDGGVVETDKMRILLYYMELDWCSKGGRFSNFVFTHINFCLISRKLFSDNFRENSSHNIESKFFQNRIL